MPYKYEKNNIFSLDYTDIRASLLKKHSKQRISPLFTTFYHFLGVPNDHSPHPLFKYLFITKLFLILGRK
jgi:hypothetical protein